jgi:protein CWC15
VGASAKGKGKAPADDDDDDDDDDDTAELLRELERIKRERAEEQDRAAKLKAAEEERIRTEQILVSNPLLNQPTDYALKKKWYDDVIFKNCAKNEPEVKKRFINDTIRSDFHRKFLSKYVA